MKLNVLLKIKNKIFVNNKQIFRNNKNVMVRLMKTWLYFYALK